MNLALESFNLLLDGNDMVKLAVVKLVRFGIGD